VVVGIDSFNLPKRCQQKYLQLQKGTVPFSSFLNTFAPGRDASRRCGMQFSATSRAHDGPAIMVDLSSRPLLPIITKEPMIYSDEF
jgi:hypothetical protein